MVALLLTLLIQSPAAATPTVDLPVSLERVRQGLARKPVFDFPRSRAWIPVFRSRVQVPMLLEGDAWTDTSMIPVWVQTSTPALQFEFLQTVTPPETRASTIHPCCDVLPAVSAVTRYIGKRVEAVKQGRAKREVEAAMRAAGIRR
jgi:hypothetical protein